jgi:hypothetical protein
MIHIVAESSEIGKFLLPTIFSPLRLYPALSTQNGGAVFFAKIAT